LARCNGNAELLIAPESPHAFNRMNTAIARKVRHYVEAWLLERFSDAATGDQRLAHAP